MFGVLATRRERRNSWSYQTKCIDDTVAAGGRMFGKGTTRSINAIFSLKSYLPFDVLPAWRRSARLAACRKAAGTRRQARAGGGGARMPRDSTFGVAGPRKPSQAGLHQPAPEGGRGTIRRSTSSKARSSIPSRK
jgi:hypothetical protein